MDILQSQIVVAILALTAMPAVVSGITALLRKASSDGFKPEVILYLLSGVVVLVALLTSGFQFPGFNSGDPAGTAMAWIVFTQAFAGWTGILYDVFLKRFWPGPTPPPVEPPALPAVRTKV